MAEVNEIFEDFGETVEDGFDNLKEFVKSKPFLVVVIVVCFIALIVWLRSRNTVETTDEVATFYTYPTTGGGGGMTFQGESMGDNSDYYDLLSQMQDNNATNRSEIEEIKSSYNTSITELETQYGSQISEMTGVIDALSQQTISLKEQAEQNAAAMTRNQLLAQMQSNSDLWILTDDEELRKKLHDENLAIADMLGLQFDKSGSYYDSSGNMAYMTTLQSYKRNEQNTTYSSPMVTNQQYQNAYSGAVASTSTQYVGGVDPTTYQAPVAGATVVSGIDPTTYQATSAASSASKSSGTTITSAQKSSIQNQIASLTAKKNSTSSSSSSSSSSGTKLGASGTASKTGSSSSSGGSGWSSTTKTSTSKTSTSKTSTSKSSSGGTSKSSTSSKSSGTTLAAVKARAAAAAKKRT